MKRIQHSARAGFTLAEVVIAALILALLAGSLLGALDDLRSMTVTGSVDSKLQDSGERALMRIIEDLKRSGARRLGGKDYPYVFDGGVPANGFPVGNPLNDFDAHAHVPNQQMAQAGDLDFGLSREIVFIQPADANGDERPDVDANGEMVWNLAEFSYVLVTRPDGINYLERRTNGANPQRVATFVERVVFDNWESSGFAIPQDSVRVQVFLRQRDGKGMMHRYTAQAVVKLRN